MKDLAMNKLTHKTRSFWCDEEGLTVVGYAVVGGLIALTALAAFQALGESVYAVIGKIMIARTALAS